jgi:hypothetical protein
MDERAAATGAALPSSFARTLITFMLPALALFLGFGSWDKPASRASSAAPAAQAADEQAAGAAHCEARFSAPFLAFTDSFVARRAGPSTAHAARELASTAPEGGDHEHTPCGSRRGLGACLAHPLQGAVRVETLIATLPDPIDTGLGYHFDSQLHALRLGIEAPAPSAAGGAFGTEGFYRDRHWLPWDDREARDKAKRELSRECRREWPGVILFRGSDREHPSLLVLLIVGESPIYGVHPAAMRSALELALELQQPRFTSALTRLAGGQPENAGLRIVGPSFSGSAVSLRAALDGLRAERVCDAVRIVSGSATGPQVASILRQHPPFRCDPTEYHATTVPGRALECSFLHYVERAGATSHPERDGSRTLDGVAILQESGTEFGASLSAQTQESASRAGCQLQAEVSLSFPHNVSSIRDAYEELDAQHQSSRARIDPSIARHTSLAISLRREQRLDLEATSSEVTQYAQDLSLGNVLSEISREGVRWVGIQATDSADAVFLARRIRDVAPDVRLAFFNADSLLLHPSFRHDLLGSLVVSPYPFLGSDDFSAHRDGGSGSAVHHAHASFENDNAEGTFNAVRALRQVPAAQLTEYAFITPPEGQDELLQPLPIWISAIGQGGFVPIQTRPGLDCDGVIVGNSPAPRDLCEAGRSREQRRAAWHEFNRLRTLNLSVDPDITPPRLWTFVFAALALVCVLHVLYQRRVERDMGSEEYPQILEHDSPATDDSLLDRCIVRTKWRIYALCAKTALCLGVVYMTLVYAVSAATYAHHASGLRFVLMALLALTLFVSMVVGTVRDARLVVHELAKFRRLLRVGERPWMQANGLPSPQLVADGKRWGRRGNLALLYIGCADTAQLGNATYVSYALMRSACVLAAAIAFVFLVGVVRSLLDAIDFGHFSGEALPAMTLFVLRSLPIANGVSPAAPLLLAVACTYVWAVGRMGRLRLVFDLSRISPQDGVVDCVSTPIRAVLFPSHSARHIADQGFTRAERQLTNAILRPSGKRYFSWIAVVCFLPVVLFFLKHPTTLEPIEDTWLLFGSLALCGVLVAATLVQLVRYWHALDALLKRVAEHPLGRAFARLPAPFTESVDAQVSQRRDDRLYLMACKQAYDQLGLGSWRDVELEVYRAVGLTREGSQRPPSREEAEAEARRAAGESMVPLDVRLAQPSRISSTAERPRDAEDELGKIVIRFAIATSKVLERVWDGGYRGTSRAHRHDAPPRDEHSSERDSEALGTGTSSSFLGKQAPKELDVSHDPLSALAGNIPASHFTWLRAAETYVAAVVSMLLNLHVRQFRYFLYALTGSSLLLLGAIASYPFEPHRTLMTCIWVLVSSVALTCLWVFVQLDRDRLLSAIGGDATSAGKVTWNRGLAYRIAVWVILPLLGLMAAQYPAVANQVFTLLEPFGRTLR